MKIRLQLFGLILMIVSIAGSNVLNSQSIEFYGMTAEGGSNNTGSIFKTDGNGDNFHVIFSFPPEFPHGQNGSLLLADNGRFYGTTWMGGSYRAGVLYEWDPLTEILTKKIDFKGGEDPGYPGELMQAKNGKIYLLTGGGAYNMGTLCEWDPESNTLTTKFDFNTAENGRDPYGSLYETSDGKLYGSTYYGGKNDAGILFEWDPATDTFTKKIDYDSQSGFYPGLFYVNESDKLLSVSSFEGINALYKYDPDSNVYSRVFDFGVKESGTGLTGPLIRAANGKLYGMANAGNFINGVIFELDSDTAGFTKILDFNIEDGQYPEGSLVEADNGKLYGMTTSGGMGMGVLFELDPESHGFVKKMNFTGTENGSLPIGNLIKAANGKLYGKTAEGGIYNFGVLFEWDPATDTFTKKLDFTGTENGRNPIGRMLLASDGNLYGATSYGGLYEKGILFKLDPTTDTFTRIIDFNGSENGTAPTGYMIEGDNGKLYGITLRGGAGYDSLVPNFQNGVLFEFNTTTESFTKKMDFNGFEKGRGPAESLVMDRQGKIYGMTNSGGALEDWFNPGYGILFEWDPVTDNFIKKMDFNPFQNDGFNPGSSLIRAENGKLYGTTGIGGAYEDNNHWGSGVLFEWDPENDTYTKLKVFSQPEEGVSPNVTLVQARNGKFYGSTSRGGIYTHTEPVGQVSNGVLFEWDPSTSTYTKKLDLNETETGFSLTGPLLLAENGRLYGMNSQGGLYGGGVFFEWDPETNLFTKKLDLPLNGIGYTGQRLLMNEKKDGPVFKESKSVRNISESVETDSKNICGGLVEVKHTITGPEVNRLKSEINIYPNPSNGLFTIDLGKTYPKAEITISQTDGRIILQEYLTKASYKEIQLSGSPGLYLVSITSGNEKAVFKLSIK